MSEEDFILGNSINSLSEYELNLINNGIDKFNTYTTINTNIEYEVRFGKFVYSKQNNSKIFDSNVNIDFFYRLKENLESQFKNNQQSIKKYYTIESSKEYNYVKYREIKYTNEFFKNTSHIEYMTKKSIEKSIDIINYNFRTSLSNETKIKEVDYINLRQPINMIRNKFRTSYLFKFGKVDLTIVNGTNYEIEFELKQGDYKQIIYKFITHILQIQQRNKYLISSNEHHLILQNYKNLTNMFYFIGAQPETLHKDQLSLLFKELYSVTEKLDGDRYFMFINNENKVYFIDNNMKILRTNLVSNDPMHKNTIIDGELLFLENYKINFYAFDLLFFNNTDIRENNNYYLKNRLEIVNKIVESFNTNDTENDLFQISMKTFIYKNVFLGSESIMNEAKNKGIEDKLDGLIYTPMNEAYPKNKKWSKLLKWKPLELNTIDFYSIKKESLNGISRWELYVQYQNPNPNPNSNNKNSNETVLFKVNELCSNSNTIDITYETTFEDSLIDKTTNQNYISNTVIEYKWDVLIKKFIPIRTRWDKTAEPNKHGNFYKVACDIWNNINNPITTQQLFQMTNSSTKDADIDASFFF